MIITATLKEDWTIRTISMEVPTLQHPLLPFPYVDSRWARPVVFHDVSNYPLAEADDVNTSSTTPSDFLTILFEVVNVVVPTLMATVIPLVLLV